MPSNLERAEPDLLRAMLKTFVDALTGAEADAQADAVCGAPYGAATNASTPVTVYRPREWDTRAGTLEVAIPKLRSGSYFPDWLLERRRRAERALTTVVATVTCSGVDTADGDTLVETLGITRIRSRLVCVVEITTRTGTSGARLTRERRSEDPHAHQVGHEAGHAG